MAPSLTNLSPGVLVLPSRALFFSPLYVLHFLCEGACLPCTSHSSHSWVSPSCPFQCMPLLLFLCAFSSILCTSLKPQVLLNTCDLASSCSGLASHYWSPSFSALLCLTFYCCLPASSSSLYHILLPCWILSYKLLCSSPL